MSSVAQHNPFLTLCISTLPLLIDESLDVKNYLLCYTSIFESSKTYVTDSTHKFPLQIALFAWTIPIHCARLFIIYSPIKFVTNNCNHHQPIICFFSGKKINIHQICTQIWIHVGREMENKWRDEIHWKKIGIETRWSGGVNGRPN